MKWKIKTKLEDLKEMEHLEDLNVNGRTMLNYVHFTGYITRILL
jgi:hypothetical protein